MTRPLDELFPFTRSFPLRPRKGEACVLQADTSWSLDPAAAFELPSEEPPHPEEDPFSLTPPDSLPPSSQV